METPVFVARERELRRLDAFLDRALAGQGQICFVSGEAGSGKTALLTEFARRAEAQHPDLVAALGQADAQTGIGDPYLPFREVLSQLTGDVDLQRARAVSAENTTRLRKLVSVSGRFLVEMAPELVALFVPGAGVAMKAAKATADKAGWLGRLEKLAQRPKPGEGPGGSGLEQDLVFEQYTRFLTTLAEKKPLLLLLDDLQWADPSSLALLFRLGRRMGQSRILLAGSYRPEEVAQDYLGGRHPLAKVLAELKRSLGDIEVDLDRADEAERGGFVEAFLDSEPNALDERFRRALLQHTDGHALFTVELLRALQERGDLVRDAAGRWVPGAALDWGALPPRVEGVLEERIGRLAEELRAVLTVASVEGEEFTAEVVAQVRSMDTRDLVQRLSEDLQKEHRLVSAQGLRRLQARRLALYRFQHNLFQKYLYNGMDAVQRAYLHEDVGNVLEALYGEQTDDVAVQLARHFGEAGMADKAVHYLRRSGELAAARYANEEAAAYFSRALALLPETELAGRYGLLLAREQVCDRLGQRDVQKRDLAELETLAQRLGAEQQAEVAVQRSKCAMMTGDYPASLAAAQVAVEQARAVGHTGLEALGHLRWGVVLWRLGDLAAARGQAEAGLALARAAGLPEVEAKALFYLGTLEEDSPEQRSHLEQALHLYQEIGDRLGAVRALYNLGVHYKGLGDFAGTWSCFQQALRQSREFGDPSSERAALWGCGNVRFLLGDYTQAQEYFEESLCIARELQDLFWIASNLASLGELRRRAGDYASAQEYAEQAVGVAGQLGDLELEAEVLEYLGGLHQDLGNPTAARACYEQALHLHRDTGSSRYAMVSLAGLASAALALGDLAQAQAHVAEILAYLDAGGVVPADSSPFWVYLTCYQVLRAGGEPRATEILATAHRLLQEHAARIPDEATRHSFLENVAENREIVAEFARSQQAQ